MDGAGPALGRRPVRVAGCLGERAGCVVGERAVWLLLRAERHHAA